MITLFAPAKINLVLEVLGRRGDGYHQVSTVLQAVSLEDRVSAELGEGIRVECHPPLPTGEENLAQGAARRLAEAADRPLDALIRLQKAIPVAAGLGGGSSDAAATLLALNRLWGLSWPREKLQALAARIGSDVPFFLYGGTALGGGRGEVITPLPLLGGWWVLFCPPIPSPPHKTEQLYRHLTPAAFTSGEHSRKLVAGIRAGGAFQPSYLYNAFERVAYDFFPGLRGWVEGFHRAGAQSVHLSGTGPCLFTWAEGEAEAKGIQGALKQGGQEAYVVQSRPALAY